MQRTAECVSPGHPDKICDFIADSLLDKYLESDAFSRCAIEVLGGHGLIVINGEVTSNTDVDVEGVVKSIVGKCDGKEYKVIVNLVKQSGEIARGVDTGGAGDQGIMVGYACDETENLVPLEYELARNLCKEIYKVYPYDGKTQVTIDGDKAVCVVASFQNTKTPELLKLVEEIIEEKTSYAKASAVRYIINPAGEWNMGGFDADTGLSGRKIVIDNYGPRIGAGGGSFSGKDYTKVDRSGAYMARKIAVDLIHKSKAHEVLVHIAYAIGIAEPVMATALVDGKETQVSGYDLTPKGIRETLKLSEVEYAPLARFGHFGHDSNWDK